MAKKKVKRVASKKPAKKPNSVKKTISKTLKARAQKRGKKAGKKSGKTLKTKKALVKGKRRKLTGTSADNKIFYNELKKEVSVFYKKQMKTDRLDRAFLESRTKYLFKILKSQSPGGVINDNVFKGFANNLEFMAEKPATSLLQKEIINETGVHVDWWNLESFIQQHMDQLDQASDFQIIMSDILGQGYDQQESDIKSLNVKEAVRDLRQMLKRMGVADKSDVMSWTILKSKDNESIVFQLSTSVPEDKLRLDEEGIIETTDIPVYEEEEEEEAAAPEKGKPGKPTEETPTQKKKGQLELLVSKKESFQKDIEFNNKQIREIAEVIKVLKEVGVPFKEEKKRIAELSKENSELSKDISEINKKIKDL